MKITIEKSGKTSNREFLSAATKTISLEVSHNKHLGLSLKLKNANGRSKTIPINKSKVDDIDVIGYPIIEFEAINVEEDLTIKVSVN